MKKFLLIVIAFVSLSAFSIKEIKVPNTNKGTRSDMPYVVPPDARIVSPSNGSIIVLENMPIELKATVTGRPEPTFKVFKDGLEINNSTHLEIGWSLEAKVVILIKSPVLSDTGKYKITFRNRGGEVSVVFTVTVIKKPHEA